MKKQHEVGYDDYFTVPLRPLLDFPNSYKDGIKALRAHFPGVFPDVVDKYIDPFLREGPMYFNIKSKQKWVNDFSQELIAFYELVRDKNKEFFKCLEMMSGMWEFLDELVDYELVHDYQCQDYHKIVDRISDHHYALSGIVFTTTRLEFLVSGLKTTALSCIKRFRQMEIKYGQIYDVSQYIEAAFKEGLYNHVKSVYNDLTDLSVLKVACWYFLRRYACQGIYRMNQYAHFTTPYAGKNMNPHLPDIETHYWTNTDLTAHLKDTEFNNLGFVDFLVDSNPQVNDFVYLNLPSPNRGSLFDEQHFTYDDHGHLAEWLLTECRGQWLVMMKPNDKVEKFYKKHTAKADLWYFDNEFRIRYIKKNKWVDQIVIKNY